MGVTIIDVAKKAGVSKATVSRYFNDRENVREETAQRIEQAVHEMNFIPNASARNLALKSTDTLGVLISSLKSSYWNKMLESMHNYASKIPTHYEIFTLNCDSAILDNTNKTIRDKIRVLIEQRVAGIIVALRDISQADIDYMYGQDIPFVVVQSNRLDDRVSYVNVDNYKASFEAAQYIMQMGHKSIAYIRGPVDAIYESERFEGFRDALISKRIFQRTSILHGDNTYRDGYWRMKQILSWNSLPTAVMTSSDSMAYGAINAMNEAGIRIPEDMSIIGFDGLQDELEIYQLLPPLTTVYQPISLIGERAVEITLKKIQEKKAGKSKVHRVMLPTRFMDWGSCKNLKNQ